MTPKGLKGHLWWLGIWLSHPKKRLILRWILSTVHWYGTDFSLKVQLSRRNEETKVSKRFSLCSPFSLSSFASGPSTATDQSGKRTNSATNPKWCLACGYCSSSRPITWWRWRRNWWRWTTEDSKIKSSTEADQSFFITSKIYNFFRRSD